MRRRPVWPWLLALGLIVSAGVAGWYVWTQIQSQLSKNAPVTVPLVEGLKKENAIAQLDNVGLKADVQEKASPTVDKGVVVSQSPAPGDKTDKGNQVTIVVSTGKPKVTVPDLKGDDLADAIAQLTEKHLKYKTFQVNSGAAPNTVTATAPPGGAVVPWGTQVRVNVSKGPKPLPIPADVIGQPYDNANSELQGAGFKTARNDVDSDKPKDTVVSTDPPAGSSAPAGSTVTLNVSKGPKQAPVPDVTGYSEADAKTTLEGAGFKVKTTDQQTSDPTVDGTVISQDPPGLTQAKPGTTVTIVVGRLVAQTDTTPTTTDTTPTG